MKNNNKLDSEDIPLEIRRKAQRTIWILYGVMAFLILLPFVMLFFR